MVSEGEKYRHSKKRLGLWQWYDLVRVRVCDWGYGVQLSHVFIRKVLYLKYCGIFSGAIFPFFGFRRSTLAGLKERTGYEYLYANSLYSFGMVFSFSFFYFLFLFLSYSILYILDIVLYFSSKIPYFTFLCTSEPTTTRIGYMSEIMGLRILAPELVEAKAA